ncbi:hypothetical protein H7J06_17895 [Mycobacterium hodleri]|uniref:WXG100 family type VII secretion target n=1 Tax=Mycolicibacterium hodleri TaxID=49897 RepID=UPI0021F3BCC8|nr:hypothetical protein [Mycolicibacterium hodleri]MCV7134859.1 hypothetical protein [Mycolicibacterium hodleri]
MLPSRPRLTSWNPESLSTGAKTIGDAGKAIFDDVRHLDDGINRLPQTRGWSGSAHEAANEMFGRAVTRTSKFLDYADAVSKALSDGAAHIGRARTDLLREADVIDRTELSVNDQWVVLVKPAAMTAEHAAALQKQAVTAQAEINPLVQAVGDADDETTRNLLVARAGPGGDFQVHAMGPPGPVPPVPGNEVPDPSTDAGRQLQEMVREQDLSTSVRETTETTDERTGNHIKTVFMMDGSKQVITTEGGWPPSEHVLPEGSIQVEQYDKAGNYVSDSLTTESEDGTQTTNIWWTDGTSVVMTRTPDGKCTGGVTTPDGKGGVRHGILPDEFFADPIPTVAGGALTGLEKQAERGIPGLSAEALENIGAGAKFGGPALGVATALYNVATAETAHDVCVNAWSGGVGVVGGIGFDAALTVMAPELAPVWAAALSTTGGFGFGYLGGIVGNLVCPP